MSIQYFAGGEATVQFAQQMGRFWVQSSEFAALWPLANEVTNADHFSNNELVHAAFEAMKQLSLGIFSCSNLRDMAASNGQSGKSPKDLLRNQVLTVKLCLMR